MYSSFYSNISSISHASGISHTLQPIRIHLKHLCTKLTYPPKLTNLRRQNFAQIIFANLTFPLPADEEPDESWKQIYISGTAKVASTNPLTVLLSSGCRISHAARRSGDSPQNHPGEVKKRAVLSLSYTPNLRRYSGAGIPEPKIEARPSCAPQRREPHSRAHVYCRARACTGGGRSGI